MKNFLLLLVVCSLNIAHAAEPVYWQPEKALSVAAIKKMVSDVDVSDIKEFTETTFDVHLSVNSRSSQYHLIKIYYFPDVSSLQNFGTDSIRFNDGQDRLDIYRVASLSPDGVLKELTREDMKVNDSNSNNTFTSSKEAVFAFPGLAPGFFAVVEYQLTSELAERESDWYKSFYPTNLYPRKNYSIEVKWSDDFPLQFSNSNSHVSCSENKNQVKCEGRDIAKVKSDKTVYWADELGVIEFGQFSDWSQVVSRSLGRFNKSQIGGSSEIDAFVKGLLAGEVDTEKQISIIHKFVSQKIQYVSMSENGNSYTPHSVLRTLKNRIGDCKDKSALYFSMLKSIGVNAFPVLVATDRYDLKKASFPTMGIFDHMIVCFTLANNKMHCSDPTNTYANWRYISPYIQGNVALSLEKKSKFFNIPSSQYRWGYRIKTHLVFDDKGGQVEEQEREYLDEYANFWRDSLNGKSNDDIQEYLVKDYKDNVANKVDVELRVSDLTDLEKNVVINSTAKYSPFIDVKDDLDYHEYDAWIYSELDYFLIKNKIYKYHFSGLHLASSITWDVSSRWRLASLPATAMLTHKYGEMIRKVKKLDSGRFQIFTELKIPQQIVPADEIEAFNQFIGDLKSEAAVYVYAKHL